MTSITSEAALPRISPTRIRMASRLLSLLCLLGMVTLPLVVAAQWAFGSASGLLMGDLTHLGVRDPRLLGPVDVWQRVLGGALTMVSVAFAIVALNHARRCFHLLAGGVYFDPRVVFGLRGFSGATALSVACGLILQGPITAVVSWNNPPGQRFIEFGLSSQQIYALFFAGTVWLIAAVMAEAVQIARENAEFI